MSIGSFETALRIYERYTRIRLRFFKKLGLLIRKIYKYRVQTEKELLKPGKTLFYGSVILNTIVGIGFGIFKIEWDIAVGVRITIGVIAVNAFVFLIAKIAIDYFLQNEGNFDFIQNEFFKITDSKIIRLNTSDLDAEKFSFMDDNPLSFKKCAEMNITAFRYTAWAGMPEEKEKRNTEHFRKNNYSILFTLNDKKKAIGFTHILPVNLSTWLNYRDATISDDEFTAQHITPPKSIYVDEQPFGLLLFTVAVAEPSNDTNNLFIQAITYHIKSFCEREFSSHRFVPVMFHSMQKSYLDFFKDCKTNGTEYSKDDAEIVCFEVKNPLIG